MNATLESMDASIEKARAALAKREAADPKDVAQIRTWSKKLRRLQRKRSLAAAQLAKHAAPAAAPAEETPAEA